MVVNLTKLVLVSRAKKHTALRKLRKSPELILTGSLLCVGHSKTFYTLIL